MQPTVFLDEVTAGIQSYHGVSLHRIDLTRSAAFNGREVPPDLYVADFPGMGLGQELLLQRQAVGFRKFLMIQTTAHSMLRTFARFNPDLFNQRGAIAQFLILWGGRSMDLLTADPPIFKEMIDTTILKIKRRLTEDKTDWVAECEKMIGDWYKRDLYIACEECLASGANASKFAELAFQNHVPKTLIIFPVCASLEGIEKLYKICKAYGVRLIAIVNSALIQVAQKGADPDLPKTDLGMQPLTVVSREFAALINNRYQNSPICWVGDIGDSIHKVRDHLRDTLKHMRIFRFDPRMEDWSSWPKLIHSREFKEELRATDEKTFRYFASVL